MGGGERNRGDREGGAREERGWRKERDGGQEGVTGEREKEWREGRNRGGIERKKGRLTARKKERRDTQRGTQ